MAKGSFGACYEAIDTQDNDKPVVCKINNESEMNQMEASILKKLNLKGFTNFPQLLGMGYKYHKHYQILERFGKTLEFYQMVNRDKFSFTTVNLVGI